MYIQIGEKWICLHTNGVVHLSFTLFHFKMLILLSKECLCDKILQYLSTAYFISFTLSSMSSIIVSNVVLVHFDWCALFLQCCCSGYQCCRISRRGRHFGALCQENPANPWPCTSGTTTWTASLMPWWSSATPVAGRRKNTHTLAYTPLHTIWSSVWVMFVGEVLWIKKKKCLYGWDTVYR